MNNLSGEQFYYENKFRKVKIIEGNRKPETFYGIVIGYHKNEFATLLIEITKGESNHWESFLGKLLNKERQITKEVALNINDDKKYRWFLLNDISYTIELLGSKEEIEILIKKLEL